MSILNYISGDKSDKRLSAPDVKDIKSLVTVIGGVIAFLQHEKNITPVLHEQMITNRKVLSRILNSSEYHFIRYISEKELEALIQLIHSGEEIINAGQDSGAFLASKEFVIKFYSLLDKITKKYTRWLDKPSYPTYR
jgi:hypothetical protein